MTQDERRAWLIGYLLAERPEYAEVRVPDGKRPQRDLLRGLLNVREPDPVTDEFLAVQDAYLQGRIAEMGVTRLADLRPVGEGGTDAQLFLWRGDITTLAVGAIVNAANAALLGCFAPNHYCIDNAIHTFAGVQLRAECARIMAERGRPEPTATATVTGAYNLPADRVIHTVGPIVRGAAPGPRNELMLRRCYRSCLDAAQAAGCASVALCCVSTGVFGYPNEPAARTAVDEVRGWLDETGSEMRVVFNVFLEEDEAIYRALLRVDRGA